MISSSAIARCPELRLDVRHYRDDGTCLHESPKVVIRRLGWEADCQECPWSQRTATAAEAREAQLAHKRDRCRP